MLPPPHRLPRVSQADLPRRATLRIWDAAALAFSCVAILAWLAHAFDRPRGVAFAVVTNLAFVADVVLIPIATAVYVVDSNPFLFATTYASALAGAGSFAHHIDRQSGDPAHVLDIAMAWVMYWHLAVVAAYALAYRVIGWPRLIVAAALVEAVGLVILFACYSEIKPYQIMLLVMCGLVAHGCTLAHRLRSGAALLEAILDLAAIVWLQACATVLQGQVAVDARSAERYNIEHGYWHILNGVIVGVVVLQTCQLADGGADAAREPAGAASRGALVVFTGLLVGLTLANASEQLQYELVVPLQLALLAWTAWRLTRATREAQASC